MGPGKILCLGVLTLFMVGYVVQTQAQICYYYISAIGSYNQYYRTYYTYHTYYYYRCGWWGWRRCRGSRTYYVYYTYAVVRYNTRYIRQHYCCSGYTGSNCDPICYNSCGKCDHCVSPYNCHCQDGYQGWNCCTDCNECSGQCGSPNNGGCEHYCSNYWGGFYCTCQSGYTLSNDGLHCTDIHECLSNKGGCEQNCHDTNGGYYCTCDTGYTLAGNGKDCNDINECNSDNGGCQQNCMNQPGTYHCTCDEGFTLHSNGHSCIDHNECTNGEAQCNHYCVNTPGSYYCYCKTGYELTFGDEQCIDTMECNNNNGGCDHNCTNTIGSYYCTCNNGYRLNGNDHTCDDIDECYENSHLCDHNCYNNVGSYSCDCDIGYRLQPDGFTCLDIDECAEDTDGCDVDYGICVNEVGSYHCECIEGFLLDDDLHGCSDHDECNTGAHHCDPRPGVSNCHNTHGTYYCTCNTGYRLNENGNDCDDIDECAEDISGCQQICNNIIGSYYCTCHDGFELDDDQHGCHDIDECMRDTDGCEVNCHNLIGSYYCSCDVGYQVSSDKHTCEGQPCSPVLTAPENGAFDCTGDQVTAESCTFWCDNGYELVGQPTLTCQITNAWTAVQPVCSPKHCDELQPPKSGYLAEEKCDTVFKTECEVRCLDGYYIEGAEMPYTRTCVADSNNKLYWDNEGDCTFIPPCNSNPCANNGKCTDIDPTTYKCDCTGTGFTGKNCDLGKIEISDFPVVNLGDPINIVVVGPPIEGPVTVTVSITPPGAIVVPSTLTLDGSTPATISVNVSAPGICVVSYSIESDDEIDPPSPQVLLVVDPNAPHVDNSYFNAVGTSVGMLAPGCCSPGGQIFQCPGTESTVSFTASCDWLLQGIGKHATQGIIYANGAEGTSVPLSIAGVHLGIDDNNVEYSLPGFYFGCDTCAESCNHYDFTANDIADLLQSRALGMTYVNKVNEMTPQWMSFSIAALETLEGLTFGTEDYITYLTVGANIADVPGCEYLDLVPDVLYSVYSHRDNVDVTFNDVSYTYTYTAGGTPVCFAINLCDGTTAPIHLALPADAHDIITSIPAVRDYNDDGFNFDFHEVMVSDNGISVSTSDLPQFWNGDSYVDPAEALSDFELRLELDIEKNFYQQKNIGLKIEFTGEAYIRADEISLARDHHEEGAVQALFDGELEAVLNATFGGSMAKMDLKNDGTPFVATMPEYTTIDSVIPNGASLKLNYYENFEDTFFTTVIPVPSDAGKCPMDTFIGFTSERLISSINMQTQCPDLSINGYTFSGNDGLQLSISLSADTGVFAVDGTLPVATQPLNEYVAIEQADGSSAIHVEWLGSQTSGWISDLDFSLFGTSFVSRATIDNAGFRFAPEGTQTLFGTFDGVFNGTIVSGYSWEDPKIDVDGVFDAGTDSFVRNTEAYIYDYTNTKIAKSAERKQLAQSALDDTVAVAGVYQSNAQTQTSQLNDINTQVQTAQNTLASAQATLDAASALLTDDTNYLTNLFDEVCAVQNCDDFCVQSVTCSSCPLKTTVDQHGIEESTTLEEMTANREVSYSWEACALENVCRQFPRIKGWALTGIDQICNSAYVRETIMGTTYETYSEWQEILHVDSYVAQTKKLTIPQSCCATDTCGLTVSDPTCVYNNAACAFATIPVYLSLNETEQALLQPVLNYLAALSNATLLSNDLATLTAMQTAKQGIVDQQQAAYENLELDATEAQENLDNIIAEEGPISALADTLGNTPIQTVFTITGMSFSVSVPSSTPNTLPVTIFYTVVPAGNFWHTMDIDFTATPAIINRDIADALLEQVGMKLQGQNGKKRQVDSSFNHQQFELRCARLHAVDGYLSELFRTLKATLEYQTAAMMNMSSTLAALDTVVTTPTEFPHIDRLLLAGTYETDYSFDQLLQAAEADQLVVGLKQNIADLQTYLAAQQGTVESFAFASWQISIVYAHNKPFIEGIADSSCYGFSDCINTAANIIEQLLTDSTTTNAATWLAALPAARASLLQLTTATSWNISQLVSEQPSGLNYIVKQLIDEGYWCSTPPTITAHPVDTSVTVGNTLTLSCSAQSDLDIWYTWLRNGFQVASGTSSIFSKTAEAIDVGQYQCIARNAKGESLSDFAMVTVYEAPVITAHPQDYDTFLGSDQGGWFQCSATGHPDPCFEWYFGLERDTDNWVLLDDSSSQLVITNPTLSNQGWYRCKATSGDSFAWSDPAHLFVLGASISKLSYTVTVHMVVTDTVPVVSSGDSDRTNPPPAGSSWEEVRSQLISELGLQYTDVEDIEIVQDTAGDGFTLSLKLTTSFDYDPTRSVAEQAEEASEYRDGLEHGLYVLELKLQDDALWIQLDDQYYIVEHQTSIISDLEYLCPRGQIPGYSNFLCVNCTYGTHWKEVDGVGQCVACDKGTYLASDGSFDCVACPPNTDTLSDGSKWPSDCIPFCSVDYYSWNGLEPCTMCANFTHQPQMGQTSCINCTEDLRGVITNCGEPTVSERQTGSNVPAIAGGVAGGVVALLVVILLVIIILAVVLKGRGNKTEQTPGFNAGKRHSASNPLYVPPNDVLSLVPESEHVPQPIKYQVNEGKKITIADSDERDVVNPLYNQGEVDDEYDQFGSSGPSAVNRTHDGVRDQIDGDVTYDEIPADTKYTMATEKSGLYSKQ